MLARELAKRTEEAPMGRTLPMIRRLVRLIGDGVLLGCRGVFCGGGFEVGALVGSLALNKLLLSACWLEVSHVLESSLVMLSMWSAVGG